LPWTDSRSRDEWLAEVRRRGERIRRRRRIGCAAVVAVALVLPVNFTAAALRSTPGREVELTVAGPALVGDAVPPPAQSDVAASADEPPPAATAFEAPTTTVAERQPESISPRIVPETPLRAFVAPVSPAPEAPADDPVVRPTTTVPPPQTIGNPVVATNPSTGAAPQISSATPASAATTTASAASAPSSLPACAAEALQIDVVPSKPAFLAGETVRGTFFVQTFRATDCSVAMPASFRIENVATGAVLGSVTAITAVASPVRADGTMYTSTFAWEPRDCSGSVCTDVPPGLYQAVAQWTDGTPYRGWGEFRIGG
jgi:hypothetical protein